MIRFIKNMINCSQIICNLTKELREIERNVSVMEYNFKKEFSRIKDENWKLAQRVAKLENKKGKVNAKKGN